MAKPKNCKNMKTKKISIVLFISILCLPFAHAQHEKISTKEKKTYLKGLTKIHESELSPDQGMIDPELVPVYNHKDQRVKGKELSTYLMSGKYMPDYYVGEDKKVKAIVLRLATKEERKKMEALLSNQNNSDEMIGKTALPFSAKDMNEKVYSLDRLKGKIVVINFWFIACKPCIEEIPDMNELVNKYQNKEIEFLAFALDSKSKLEDFLIKNRFSYTIIPNSFTVNSDYQINSYPTHIVIDKDSKIAHYSIGLGENTIKDLEHTIDQLFKN